MVALYLYVLHSSGNFSLSTAFQRAVQCPFYPGESFRLHEIRWVKAGAEAVRMDASKSFQV
jgi:hypothetical protein